MFLTSKRINFKVKNKGVKVAVNYCKLFLD